MGGFLIIIVVLGLLWLFVVMPVRRKQRSQEASHAAMQDALEPGDEIITAGGLHAVIRSIDEDDLRIEIAPGVVATLDRRAVAAVAEDVDEEDEDGEDEPDRESGVEPEDEAGAGVAADGAHDDVAPAKPS